MKDYFRKVSTQIRNR